MSEPIDPLGIASTPCGLLLVTCNSTDTLYSLDPTTGHVAVVAGFKAKVQATPNLLSPACLTLVERESCAYVTEREGHCIFRVTLPQRVVCEADTTHRIELHQSVFCKL